MAGDPAKNKKDALSKMLGGGPTPPMFSRQETARLNEERRARRRAKRATRKKK
jgi:hypothetical protein